MRRKIFTTTVLLMSMVMPSTFAQSDEANSIIVGRDAIWDNWHVSGALGTSIFFGDSDGDGASKNRFTPALDISLGKWLTPYLGIRIQYSGCNLKGYTTDPNNVLVSGKSDSEGLYAQKWNYMYFHFDAMLNASNLFLGYKEDRLYSLSPYAGVGLAYARKAAESAIAINFGLNNSFRVNSSLDLFFDIRGTVMGDDAFDTEVGGTSGIDCILTTTVGVTYRFGKKSWKQPLPQVVIDDYKSTIVSNEEDLTNYKTQLSDAEKKIVGLQEQLSDAGEKNNLLQEQLSDTEKKLAALQEKPVVEEKKSEQQIKSEYKIPSTLIQFEINSYELSNIAKVRLKNLSTAINGSSPTKKYSVTGYADRSTGSKDLNDKLSQKRAYIVYEFLTRECGVDAAKLSVSTPGGVDNMFFNDASLNRVVIIK